MRRITIVVLCAWLGCVHSALAQERQITGKVTSGVEPLPFVIVKVAGTQKGAQTDFDGNYKVTIPNGGTTLIFSFIGYKTRELTIPATDSVLNVQMEPEAVQLKQVVVTALGIKKEERSLGYATQQVAGDDVRNSGEHNVAEGLAAKVAGLQVTQASGTPGASTKMQLRGISDLSMLVPPLMVVDGVPIDDATDNTVADDYPFDQNLQGVNVSNRAIDLNPDDIESISVLKGPAATALYGSSAGAGAIIITTKRGKTGTGKVNVTVGSEVQFDQVNRLPNLQNTYSQGEGGGVINPDGSISQGQFLQGDAGPDGIWGTADDNFGTPNSWGPSLKSLNKSPVDNNKNFFRTGVANNNNFAISGGNDLSTFRLSVGQLSQTGVIPNTDFKRISIRLNADTRLWKKITVSASANYINSDATMAQNGSNLSGIMLSLLRSPASYDLKGEGSQGYMAPNGQMRTYFGAYDNPFWSVYKNPFTSDVNRIIGNFSAIYKPTDWLDITERIGNDVYYDSRKQIFAIGSHGGQDNPIGQIEENGKLHSHFYNDFLVTARHTFSKDFDGSLLLGSNLQGSFDKDLYARGRGLAIPDFYNMSNASNYYSSESNFTSREAALFFNASASYKSMLYLDITGREEWFSTFGPAKPNAFFPSVSGAWVFTEIVPKNKILSFGKLRLAVASAGIAAPVYSTNTYYAKPTYTDGFTNGISFPYLGQNGYGYWSVSVMGSPTLKPEINVGKEAGLDLRFFEGRLKFDVTYYVQTTTDLLFQQPLAPSTGFKAVFSNSGSLENRGWEIVASGTAINGTKFKWDIGLNFAANKNKVLELPTGVKAYLMSATFGDVDPYAIKGQPAAVLYGSKWQRTKTGSLIIDSSTGLPQVVAEKGVIGNPLPQWTMGFRNTFSYASFTLSVLFDFRKGGDIWNGTWARLNRIGRSAESADRSHTYLISGVNPVHNGKGDTIGYVTNTTRVGPNDYYSQYLGDGGANAREQAIQDGSWVRLREVTLSYHFTLKPNVFIKGLEIYCTGRNLMLWTRYKGIDPETSLTGAGSLVNGYDYFNNPGTRSYIFGVRASF